MSLPLQGESPARCAPALKRGSRAAIGTRPNSPVGRSVGRASRPPAPEITDPSSYPATLALGVGRQPTCRPGDLFLASLPVRSTERSGAEVGWVGLGAVTGEGRGAWGRGGGRRVCAARVRERDAVYGEVDGTRNGGD